MEILFSNSESLNLGPSKYKNETILFAFIFSLPAMSG